MGSSNKIFSFKNNILKDVLRNAFYELFESIQFIFIGLLESLLMTIFSFFHSVVINTLFVYVCVYNWIAFWNWIFVFFCSIEVPSGHLYQPDWYFYQKTFRKFYAMSYNLLFLCFHFNVKNKMSDDVSKNVVASFLKQMFWRQV